MKLTCVEEVVDPLTTIMVRLNYIEGLLQKETKTQGATNFRLSDFIIMMWECQIATP